jgi:hypothetical protein
MTLASFFLEYLFSDINLAIMFSLRLAGAFGEKEPSGIAMTET